MRKFSRGARLRHLVVPVIIITAVAAVIALIVGIAVAQLAASSVASAARGGADESASGASADGGGELTAADGVLAEGTSVFDEAQSGVTKLTPELLAAAREAATAAAAEGIELSVTSGWRSPAHQERLLSDAVVNYGSVEEAARWVAAPDTSAHVAGEALDIGPWQASAWVAEQGRQFGLCQIYDNEPWHFEFRPDAPAVGCPTLYWDPTYDPRLQPQG